MSTLPTSDPAARGRPRSRSLGTALPGVNVMPRAQTSKTLTNESKSFMNRMQNAEFDESTDTLGLRCVAAATRKTASTCRATILLLVPLSMVTVQLALTGAFYLTTALKPCRSHGDCPRGEYCCACNQHCKDCSDTLSAHEYLSSEDLSEYVAICNTTDTMLTRCDHIVEHARDALALDKLAIITCSLLLAGHLSNDLTEAITEYAVLQDAKASLNGMHALIVGALGWTHFRLRVYLLPFFVIGAVASLIVMAPPSVNYTLLNFLAITFILEMDNLFTKIFVRPDSTEAQELKSAISALNQKDLRLGWLTSRAFVAALFLMTCLLILDIESFMQMIMRLFLWPYDGAAFHANFEPLGLTPYNTLITPCDALFPALQLTTAVIAPALALVHSMMLLVASWTSLTARGRCGALVDVVLTPLIVVVFWFAVYLMMN